MFDTLRSMLGGGGNEAALEALKNGAVIIDVRTPMEYRGGHVAGSKNIPLNELQGSLKKFGKDKAIIFCCASGARSGSATEFARSQGYEAHNGGPWTRVNKMVADLTV